MYCGRLAALAAWLALVFVAIKRVPALKWTYFLLAMMPMTLHLAASNSIDGLAIGLSFLASATLLEWAYDNAKYFIDRIDIAYLVLIAAGLGLSKAIYLSVLLLFLFVPRQKFSGRAAWWLSLASIMIAGAVAYKGWGWLKVHETIPGPAIQFASHGIDTATYSGLSPDRQMEFVMSEPAAFLRVVANTFRVNGIPFLHSFVGQLGWLDTVLPLWLPYVYIGILIAASAAHSQANRVTGVSRLASAMVFVGTSLAVLLLIYISTNPVRADLIGHIQGRYFIPIAPLLFLVFYRNSGVAPGRLASLLLIAFSAASTAMAAHCVMKRFYWGPGFAYQIDRVSLSPEGRVLTVTGWAAPRNGGDLSGGIELGVDGRYFPLRSGLDRPDVAEAWGEPALRYSGFEGRFASSDLGLIREHRIDLRIKTASGKTYVVPDPGILVTAPRRGGTSPR
jgi:hypothetical protein